MNYDSFGQVIAKKGERIRITNKTTKAVLDGVAFYDVNSAAGEMTVEIDGTSMKNIFKISEWTVEVVVPPLKSGLYVMAGTFYLVTDMDIRTTTFDVNDKVTRGLSTRSSYARAVQHGRMKFIGELP